MTSQLDVGKKIFNKKKGCSHPIHCNCKERIAAHLNSPGTRFLFRLTNLRYAEHFSGKETYYFTANEDWRCPDTLTCIDIDCHHCGTLHQQIVDAVIQPVQFATQIGERRGGRRRRGDGEGVRGHFFVRWGRLQ